jgi:hypothetical protein
MAKQSKSILAKLLANENIDVQYGNYQTAFFDVEKRVLGLPLWKDVSKNLTDLLIGHEVGHALYTPADGWHDSATTIPGCPRSYVNVVEDIRIEKKIQFKYPGLVRCFKLGYKDLFDKNFFGTKDRAIESYSLIDRINIKAKLRDLIEVPFSSKEQPLVDMAFKVDTWEDVIEACKALYEYMKENAEGQKNENDSQNEQLDQTEDLGDTRDDLPMAGEQSSDEDGEETKASQGLEPEEKSEDKIEESSSAEANGGDTSPENVETDEIFRSMEGELLEQDAHGRQPVYMKHITRRQFKDMLFTYNDVLLSRAITGSNIEVEEKDYKDFIDETKKVTNLLAKEFEMRKAAFRTRRAQSARSGSLDVNKLYNYKFTDDIFARVTNLADSKSHGMVMMIDFSGSMGDIMGGTLKQVLNLAMFCKKVNIPFEVYGFTGGDSAGRQYSYVGEAEVDHRDQRVFELLSSKMKKGVYEDAFKTLWKRSLDNYSFRTPSAIEEWGGTPLNEALMASRYIIEDFKAKNPVQKVNFVLLSDGDGHNVRVNTSEYVRYNYEAIIDIKGKLHKVPRRSSAVTSFLLNQLQNMDVTTVGFFLAQRAYDFNGAVWKNSDGYVSSEKLKELRKKYNKQKFLNMDNVSGFNRYFVVKSDRKSIDTDNEELEIDQNASKAQIAKAFKKYSSSKKGNRVLSAKFAEIIA